MSYVKGPPRSGWIAVALVSSSLAACEPPTAGRDDAGGGVAPADSGPIVAHDSGPGAARDGGSSVDGAGVGADDAGSSTDDGGGPLDGVPADFVPGLVAVGYGAVRITSHDGGRTWGEPDFVDPNGGDDVNLLRKVAWANVRGGTWLAVGARLFRSHEGLPGTWEPIPDDSGRIGRSIPGCAGTEALAGHDGRFYIACGENEGGTIPIWRSDDGGDTWVEHGRAPDDETGHVFMDYRGDRFVVYSDGGASWESTDAVTFTPMAGVTHANYCHGGWRSRDDCPTEGGEWSFETSEGYVRAQWMDVIRFSADGSSWRTAGHATDPLYDSGAFAEGWVAPLP